MAPPSAAIGAGPWFKERVNRNGGRLKKTTIAAPAESRPWRGKHVTAGVVIEGAVMKDARRQTLNRLSNLPEPDQFWRIRVDEPIAAMA